MEKAAKLEKLARLAQIRSDAELKRFAVFREHVDSLMMQRNTLNGKLAGIFAWDKAFSIAEARLANMEAGRMMHDLARINAELVRMQSGFDAAHNRAAREFGRVQVLRWLSRFS